MPRGVFFEAVDDFPADPREGTIYYRKREDGQVDFAVTGEDGVLVKQRQPTLQVQFWSTGDSIPGGGIFGRYLTVEQLELDALLSAAVAAVPPTNEAEITVTRDSDLVARFTFPAGQAQAQVEIFMPTVPDRNLLIFRAPLTQDATLAGVTGTLGARRT